MVYTYDADANVLYVIIVDEDDPAIDRTEEVGPNLHVDLDADGALLAELLFQVLDERSERSALITTTNLPFGEWTKVFPEPRLCKAVVDRPRSTPTSWRPGRRAPGSRRRWSASAGRR